MQGRDGQYIATSTIFFRPETATIPRRFPLFPFRPLSPALFMSRNRLNQGGAPAETNMFDESVPNEIETSKEIRS